MMIEDLQQLVRWLEDAGIGSIEIEDADESLRIALQSDATPIGPIAVTIANDERGADGAVVTAEVPGTFLVQHPQSRSPLVPLGAAVRAGELVGLVQVGPIYAPVTSHREGTLAKVLAAPGTLVGYGTPLFEIA